MSRRRMSSRAILLTCFITLLAACADASGGGSEQGDASQDLPVDDAATPQPSDAGEVDAGSDGPDAAASETDSGEPDPDAGLDPDEVVFDVEVVSTWPVAGARDVPIGAAISITFNQAMFPNSLTATSSNGDDRDHNVVLRCGGSATPIAVTRRDAADKITFVYVPNAPLPAESGCELRVRGGGDETETNDAVRSQRRTRMEGDFELAFTTAAGDVAPEALAVTSISPADGSAEVANTTSVKVTFNQPIQITSLYLVPDGQGATPREQGTFWVSESASFLFPEPGTLSLNGDLTEATFTLAPGAALASGTTYHVGLKGCADTQNPANSPCVRALSGARLEADFTASFVTASALGGTIGALYELAAGLTSDSESVATNLRIQGATMTYYRDVSNNEGFFIQREEEVGGGKQIVGIYVNTLGRAPAIPVWPMFQAGSGSWMGDDDAIVLEEELAAFAGYPVIDLEVTSVGTHEGMAYVKTDGYPKMSRAEGQADRTIADLVDRGEIAVFDRARLEALQASGESELHKKVVVGEEHLGRLVMAEGKARWTGKQNNENRVWFDLRWGTNTSGSAIIDNVHRLRVLLTQDQMDLLGLRRVTDVDQATLRVLAPLQKGEFNGEELFYARPTKISSVECNEAGTQCAAIPRTAEELAANPALLRDVVRIAE